MMDKSKTLLENFDPVTQLMIATIGGPCNNAIAEALGREPEQQSLDCVAEGLIWFGMGELAKRLMQKFEWETVLHTVKDKEAARLALTSALFVGIGGMCPGTHTQKLSNGRYLVISKEFLPGTPFESAETFVEWYDKHEKQRIVNESIDEDEQD